MKDHLVFPARLKTLVDKQKEQLDVRRGRRTYYIVMEANRKALKKDELRADTVRLINKVAVKHARRLSMKILFRNQKRYNNSGL